MIAVLVLALAAVPKCAEPALANFARRLPGLPWDLRDSEAAGAVLKSCTGLPPTLKTALESSARPWAERESHGEGEVAAAFCRKVRWDDSAQARRSIYLQCGVSSLGVAT